MGKKALVIENDLTILECVELMLEAEGVEVIRAQNGQAGLELSHRHLPDLVVSDLYMPGLTGLDVLEMIRRNPYTAGIPFIVITVDTRETVRQHCLALGADAYVRKPFTFDELLGPARTLLEKEG